MAKLTSIPILVLVGAALMISGCGGSSSLSHAELVKEAAAICSKVSEQNFKQFQALVTKNVKAFTKSPSSPEAKEVIGVGVATITVPLLQDATKEIEELDVSSEEEDEVEAFTTELKKAIKAAEEDPDGEDATQGLLYPEVHKAAREAGLKKCTSIP
jgi:ribulose kinase